MNGAVFAETVRRHLASVGFVAFVVFVALIGLFVSSFNTPAAMWPSLVTLIAIITGSALIGPEFSTGALQLIVSKPIRRPVYLLSRVAGVLACVAIAALAGASAEIFGRIAFGGRDIPWDRLGIVLASEIAVAFLVIALLTVLGSVTRAYMNAAIYVAAQAALSGLETIFGLMHMRERMGSAFLEMHPGIESGLIAFDDALFPSVPAQWTPQWMLQTLGIAAVALALACLAFQRREVPYGAD